MSALEQFSTLVATLYEAAEPQLWERFVDQFYVAMDATRGVLAGITTEPEMARVVLRGYTASERRNYSDYFWQHDVVLDAGLQTIERTSQWIGPVSEILPYRQLEGTEIYNDYYRDLDMHHASCLMVGSTGPYSAIGMAAWRPKTAGAFTAEQQHLIELLAPHLKQAFRLHAKLHTLHVENATLTSALDASAVSVIALRSNGSLHTASPPAERMLKQRLALAVRGGKLHALDPAMDRRLQQLITCAVNSAQIDLQHTGTASAKTGGSLLLNHAGRSLPLQVQVMPIRSGTDPSPLDPAVLVFIADPGSTPPSRTRVLQDLYKLTALEARLADFFLQGHDVKHAAAELKLTYETTRFHLKQIFRKTNTKRQTELLRLLLAIPA